MKKNTKLGVLYDEIPLPDLGSTIPLEYSEDIAKTKPWFPMLLLVNTNDYKEAKSNHKHKMRFVAFNGDIEGGRMVHKPTMERNDENVTNWIKQNTPRVNSGPPTIPAARAPAPAPKAAAPEEPRVVSRQKPFDVKASIFVQTCERNANITPSVRNGGYAPF
jgi:hypothetical protein